MAVRVAIKAAAATVEATEAVEAGESAAEVGGNIRGLEGGDDVGGRATVEEVMVVAMGREWAWPSQGAVRLPSCL